MTLHDDIFPNLLTWQQNFLMLNNLTITSASADGFWVRNPDGQDWRFQFTSSLAAWEAQYKGRTHPQHRKIQPYDPGDWIKL
jgi:hypothetical protein